MARTTEYVELAGVEVLSETSKAFKVRIPEKGEFWIPKSLIDEDESTVREEGDTGSVFVAEWFAVKEGLV